MIACAWRATVILATCSIGQTDARRFYGRPRIVSIRIAAWRYERLCDRRSLGRDRPLRLLDFRPSRREPAPLAGSQPWLYSASPGGGASGTRTPDLLGAIRPGGGSRRVAACRSALRQGIAGLRQVIGGHGVPELLDRCLTPRVEPSAVLGPSPAHDRFPNTSQSVDSMGGWQCRVITSEFDDRAHVRDPRHVAPVLGSRHRMHRHVDPTG
jgi:hypothetical protein